MKHTKGPWTVSNPNKSIPLIHAGRHQIGRCESVGSVEQDTANAYLTAAAPDMFEALEKALAWADPASPKFSQDSMTAVIEKMRSAIDKAKGGAE